MGDCLVRNRTIHGRKLYPEILNGDISEKKVMRTKLFSENFSGYEVLLIRIGEL